MFWINCVWIKNVSSKSHSTLAENLPLFHSSCQTIYDGLYSDPSDCSRMFWCSRGVQSKLSCPNGQFFDTYTGSCSFYASSR